MINRIFALCVIAAMSFGSVCAVESVNAKYEIIQHKDIVDVLKADGHYTQFLNAVNDAKMTDMLRNKGPFTVFAPTDEAFKSALTFPAMQPDETRLIAFVKGHMVVNHIYSSEELATLKSIRMLSGSKLTVGASGPICQVGNAHVIKANMAANNGMIHGIDAVLKAAPAATQTSPNTLRVPEPDDFISEN